MSDEEDVYRVPPEIKAAISKFEEDMKTFVELVGGADGITVDWILITAQSVIRSGDVDDTVVGFSTNLNQPEYRTKGLINQILDRLTAMDTVHIWMDHMRD